MRKEHHRIHGEKFIEYLREIFHFHSQGLSSPQIGRKLNKDHSTILHHLKKYGQDKTYKPLTNCKECNRKFTNPRQRMFCSTKCSNIYRSQNSDWARRKKRWPKWIPDYNKEKINTGKSYEEYLKNEDKRQV